MCSMTSSVKPVHRQPSSTTSSLGVLPNYSPPGLMQCHSSSCIPAGNVLEYNATELALSTDNFSILIGKGRVGSVYEGELNNIAVAVKLYDKVSVLYMLS